MKKLLSLAALAVLLGSSAQADLTRVDMGVGSWKSDPSGPITYTQGAVTETVNIADNLGFDKENFTYFWLNVKHPIPAVPNLRLEKVDVDFSGTAAQAFTWVTGGASTTYNANTVSSLQIDQTDIILYYNLLDNTAWVTLDLGIDIKLMDFKVQFVESAIGDSYSETEDIPLPMLYARTRVEIPTTDLGIEADIKYISHGGSKIYDARIKADYTFDFVPVVQPALELGYRVQNIEIDEDSLDVSADIKFSGIYGGLMLRF